MSRPRNRRPPHPGKARKKRATAKAKPKQRAPASRHLWIWVSAAVAVSAAIVAFTVSAPGGSGDGQADSPDPAIAAGAVLYAANCAVCHGPDLKGTSTGPPFLDVIYAPNHHGDEAFQQAAAAGVTPHHWNFGAMPPVGSLDRADVALIVDFVRSEQQASGILRDPSHP